MKKTTRKMTLRRETVKELLATDMHAARGGEMFTSAIGCPSAFATECCNVETLNCSKLCQA